MNDADEKVLWDRFKDKGDETAREQLILRHLRIVKFIAGRMAIHVPPSIEMNDLVGWGMLGLLDAVEKYDHRQDIKFSTYASIRVRGSIIDEIRTLDWAPRSLRSVARKIGAAKERLRHVEGREPSMDDIASELGISSDQVEDALAQVQTAQVLALDDYLPSEDGVQTRKVDLAGSAAPSPEETARRRERQQILVDAILGLPDRQQKVLNLYYYEELTLKEIGVVLEVSESRVCQIHGEAMKALRKAVQGVV